MTADASQLAGTLARRGPVFDLPPSPAVEDGRSRGLVRIVDPTGCAVAWFDPETARCVEVMSLGEDRGQATWLPIFGSSTRVTDTRAAGCDVLASLGGAIPQRARRAFVTEWPSAGWHVLQRDPTSLSLRTSLCDETGAGEETIHARLLAQLDGAALSLALTVRNDTEVESQVALGVRAVFAPGPGSNSRWRVADAGGRQTLLCWPGDRDARHPTAGLAGSAESAGPDGDGFAAAERAPQVVVIGDEGGYFPELRIDHASRKLMLEFLGAPTGEPLRLLPGACARLTISIAARPCGADDAS